jgi:uncharacterized protein (DUF433 family)
MSKIDDVRFTVPLYSLTEAAQYLNVPRSTLKTWADGYQRFPRGRRVTGAPLVTAFEAQQRGYPRLPFIGFAEAYVLNAFRSAGVPLQRIRASLDALISEVGPHALASEKLSTDGAEVLWDAAQFSGEVDGVRLLVVPRSGQVVFTEVVEGFLRSINFDAGYAGQIHLRRYQGVDVVMDPQRSYGHPIFERAGVEVENVLGRLRAGEPVEVTARDFGLEVPELHAALAATA